MESNDVVRRKLESVEKGSSDLEVLNDTESMSLFSPAPADSASLKNDFLN